MITQVFFYFLNSMVVTGLESANARARYRGYLFVGHVVVVFKVEHQALLIRQLQKCFL